VVTIRRPNIKTISTDLNGMLYTSNILSIPYMLIRYLYILLLMTKPNFQQHIFDPILSINNIKDSLDESEEV
jgi:hypothetical protein